MEGERAAKVQTVQEIPSGFFKMTSGFGSTMDQIHQNTAPLNFKDVRDPRSYRNDLTDAKDAVLRRIRLTKDAQERTRLILSYRFLQRYHKVDPTPITPEQHAQRLFLSERMDSQIEPDTRAAAHKRYFDSLYDLQQYVVDAIARVQIPDLETITQAAYFPRYDRFSTLNKEEKERQLAAVPTYEDLTTGFATSALPPHDNLTPLENQLLEGMKAAGKNFTDSDKKAKDANAL